MRASLHNDEPDPDPYTEDPAHQENEEQERRWDEFMQKVIGQRAVWSWREIVGEVTYAMSDDDDQPNTFVCLCRDFADQFGWDGVLNAVARAIREQK